MARNNINDMLAFVAVARDRSFTKAAARLGMSQSAISQVLRALEARMGVRLLARTTRSVSLTEVGQRLMEMVAPRLEEIEAEIAAASELAATAMGTIRITAIDHVIDTVLCPRLARLLPEHPDLRIEISSDYRLIDITAERYDIGVRYGDQVEKDMVAVRLTPDNPMMIVGAPSYFARYPAPCSTADLLAHNCITVRLAGSGALYAWELCEGNRKIQLRVGGQASFTGAYQLLAAAVNGIGLAFVPADLAAPHIQNGQLISVMEHCCPSFPGLYAYYSSRLHPSRAFSLVIDAIRLPR